MGKYLSNYFHYIHFKDIVRPRYGHIRRVNAISIKYVWIKIAMDVCFLLVVVQSYLPNAKIVFWIPDSMWINFCYIYNIRINIYLFLFNVSPTCCFLIFEKVMCVACVVCRKKEVPVSYSCHVSVSLLYSPHSTVIVKS